jgi:hypothetical protein
VNDNPLSAIVTVSIGCAEAVPGISTSRITKDSKTIFYIVSSFFDDAGLRVDVPKRFFIAP